MTVYSWDEPKRSGMILPFDRTGATEINKARMNHLASMRLPLSFKSVLEAGSGVGKLTAFLEARGCNVTSFDARPENVAMNLHRYPHREGKVFVADVLSPSFHIPPGNFDVVFCYGLLYHVPDPSLCLLNLARMCDGDGVLLLSSWVNGVDNGRVNPYIEDGASLENSITGNACRPARDWIMDELKRHFPFVYLSRKQPAHDNFVTSWPTRVSVPRAVFVASHLELELDTLTEELLMAQERIEER